ncbi:hypothetical protein D3C80_1473860 [compost metagenome]
MPFILRFVAVNRLGGNIDLAQIARNPVRPAFRTGKHKRRYNRLILQQTVQLLLLAAILQQVDGLLNSVHCRRNWSNFNLDRIHQQRLDQL